MGRQAIGHGADYPKLRNLFVGVVGTGLLLFGARLIISKSLRGEVPKEKPATLTSPTTPPMVMRNYRAGLKSKGSLEPKLSRSEVSTFPIVDMNDRGDFLFLISAAGADYRQYLHIYKGKSFESGKLPVTERWGLSPNGSIVKRNDLLSPFQGGRVNYGAAGWSYNEFRFFRRFTDDGSAIYVNNDVRKKQLTSRLMKDKTGSASKIYYTSKNPLGIQEIDDKGSIWVREAFDSKGTRNDRLLKFTGDKIEPITFPIGYTQVERVSATGSMLAASFGSANSMEPIRAFLRVDTGWKELPIPEGSVFSYVQKIFDDGLILGFVTDENRENMRQVVWTKDSVAILNTLPAWPKLGQFSLVTRASRKGDIYVRSVLNTENGASENYLLHVGL